MPFFRMSAAVLAACTLAAQEAPPPEATPTPETQKTWRKVEPRPEGKDGEFTVDQGTRIPLSLLNSVSTKHSAEGDRVYLETAFPILSGGRIVIPAGSYVAGTVTQVKRPGRVKGRGELFVRFDSLTLPNGVTRDFRARVGAMDGRASEDFDREEGKIRSEGNKAGDARNVGEAAAAGASIGTIAGAATGNWGMGAGIGAGAGAAAGMLGVLLSRGPDAVLAKGSTVEMVLDRPIAFTETDLDFSAAPPQRRSFDGGAGPLPSQRNQGNVPGMRRRWPF